MAKLHAMWVHGTSVQAQREGYFISKERQGWGTIFRTQGEEWFQFAIPTPVWIAQEFTTLQKIFIFYKTENGAKLDAIHVRDAGKDVQRFDGLNLGGDHSKGLDNSNMWTMNPVHIEFGLGMAVHVNFGQATPAGVPTITFFAAGADFTTP